LATLASAGARLLDQIEPRAAEEAAAAMHARRVAQEKRWGPAAVPPFPPTGPKPRPPKDVFGEVAGPWSNENENANENGSGAGTGTGTGAGDDLNAPAFPPIPPPPAPPVPPLPLVPPVPTRRQDQGAATDAYDAPPVAAPPTSPGQGSAAAQPSIAQPSIPAQGTAGQEQDVEPVATSARHRRPVYDFDDQGHAGPPPSAPSGSPAPNGPPTPSAPPHAGPPSSPGPLAVFPPSAGPAPRSPLVPGPGFGGPPQGRTLAPGNHPAYAPPAHSSHGSHGYSTSATGPGAFGFVGEDDDDEPDSLVPTSLGLRRHQRRLLIQTGAILGAIGVLCWVAVYELSSSPSHSSAAGDATHTAGKTAPAANGGTAAGGLTNQTSSSTPSKTVGATPTPSAAPSTAISSVPDTTTVSSVRVTLLGGSNAVPQIAALITVDTAGTGDVTVTGSFYGASGSKQVASESEQWTLSGNKTYQYSVPIANSKYCGTRFHFTVSAGGHSESAETSPGC
ncbi:MAG TPA: hypothetical protein VG296_17050, partial [Actinospica sp.]|nr:hypothetical protein [Actinospica sp.]